MRDFLHHSFLVSSLLLLAACLPLNHITSPSPQPAVATAVKPLRPEFIADLAVLSRAPRYDVRLTIEPAAARVTGHQEVRYTNTEEVALSHVYMRLFPNTPGFGGVMTVTNLLLDGHRPIPSVELGGSALRLPLGQPLPPGETISLGVDFAVEVPAVDTADWAQLFSIRGVMALPNVYPLVPVYDDEGWNVEVAPEYGDAVYSDVASYSVQVTAPPSLTLVASGSCSGPLDGTWTCIAEPVRDFALVLGDEYQRVSRVADDVLVNSYFRPGHESGGRAALEAAAGALEVYTGLFGPYPYAELDVVETPMRAGGMEYPGLVVIGEHLYDGNQRLEWVVAHEVAHQWWYGVVGNDQVDEPWLDEALTQYSTLIYHEVRYGPETAVGILETSFAETHRRLIAAGSDMPAGLGVGAYRPDLYGQVVYRKGPLYFHALREEVGDEAFFAVLRTYYSRHRYRIATPDSFLETVGIVTGDPHTALFERWIQGGAPH